MLVSEFDCFLGNELPPAGVITKLNQLTPMSPNVIVWTLNIANTETDDNVSAAVISVWIAKTLLSSNLTAKELYVPNRYIVPRGSFEVTGLLLTPGENIWVSSDTGNVTFRVTGWLDTSKLASVV